MSSWSRSPAAPLMASLGLVSVASALYAASSFSKASADTTPTSTEEAPKEEEKKEDEDKDKRYELRWEHYSPNTGTWEVREKTEEDEEKGLLFTAKHRTWPKSADWAGHEDYTCISVSSQSLIDILRLELKEVEEAFEDHPNLNAQDLFLHLKSLHELMGSRKKDADVLKVEEDEEAAKKDKEDDTTSKEDEKMDEEKSSSEETVKVVEEEKKTVDTEEKPIEPSTTDADPPSTTTEVEEEKEVAVVVNGEVKEEKKEEDPNAEIDEDLFAIKKKQTAAEVLLEVEHLGVLLKYIDELFAPIQSKLDRFLKENVISFQLLWAIFPPGIFVEIQDDVSGEPMAFKLKSCNYALTRDGLVFQMAGQRIVWSGSRYVKNWVNTQMSKFKGMRRIASLSAHPVSDKRKEELTARGKLYVGLARVAFVSYSGNLIQVVGGGMDRRVIKLRAEGRAVVDTKSYRRMNPSRSSYIWEDEDEDDYGYGGNQQNAANNVEGGTSVADDELCLLPPTVFGFSLVQREWGEMRVDQFSEVVFNVDAYDKLVLDADQKELVRCLVQQNSNAAKARALELEKNDGAPAPVVMHDFIEGKGGGLIIALHGRPGTGKTLTAEAVSEMLRVPLYAIGAGELGVTADILERRLRDVLDTAANWGACMLIDEADVFLEQRSMYDVTRNSLVSVFLRLLEYHTGILILTTNRIRTVDPAFLSRFSIALTYPDLDQLKRKAIWKTFIELAGARVGAPVKKLTNGVVKDPVPAVVDTRPVISSKYIDQLSEKPFNGRTAKNIMRTASSLAQGKGEPLGEEHISVVVKVTETFMADFKEPDEEGVYDAKGEGWRDRSTSYM